MKLYTCCPESDCGDYQDCIELLREWGIEPAIEFDDAHYFEFSIPEYWDDSKRNEFFKSLILKTSMAICFCGKWENDLLHSVLCKKCGKRFDVHPDCSEKWSDWLGEIGCPHCAKIENNLSELTFKNYEESHRLSDLIWSDPNLCYHNSFLVLLDISGYQDATYVEGIAVNEAGLMIEHGWIEKDNEVLDPTLPFEQMTYFPGLRFDGLVEISKAMHSIPKSDGTDEDFPIFYRFGWGGKDSEEMCQARKEAREFSNRLVEKK